MLPVKWLAQCTYEESMTAVDLFADGIALLSMLIAGVAFVDGRRQVRKRQQWEEEQQKRQTAFTQPDLVPGVIKFSLDDEKPLRLATLNNLTIRLNNEGGSTPSQVAAVVFPAARYNKGKNDPLTRKDGLGGAYWDGRLDVSPASGIDSEMKLEIRNYDAVRLKGIQCIVEGITLFAPEEPDGWDTPGSGQGDFSTGRLTITFRDREGRTLANVFDLRAMTQAWLRVVGPVEVEHDLIALMDGTHQS